MNNEYFDIYKFMYNLNLFINLLLNLESNFNYLNINIFKNKNSNTIKKYQSFIENLSRESKYKNYNYFKKIYTDIKDKDFNIILKYFNDYLKLNQNCQEIYNFFTTQVESLVKVNEVLSKNLNKNLKKINTNIEINTNIKITINNNSNNSNKNYKLFLYLIKNLVIFSKNINNSLSNQLLKLINKNSLTQLYDDFKIYLNNFIKNINSNNFLVSFFNVNLHFFKILILSNLYFIVNYSGKDFLNDKKMDPLNNYFIIYNRLKSDKSINTKNLKVRFIRKPYTTKEMFKSIISCDMINNLNNLIINNVDFIGKLILEKIDKNILNNKYSILCFLNTNENNDLISLIKSNNKYLFPYLKNKEDDSNNIINDYLIKLINKLNNNNELINTQYIEKNILVIFIIQILINNIDKINKDDNNDIVDILQLINDNNTYYLNIFLSDKEYSYMFKNNKNLNINFFEGIEYNFSIKFENELIKYNTNFDTNGIKYDELIKIFKNENNISYIEFYKNQLSINPNSFDYSFRIINLINIINNSDKLKKIINLNNNILDDILLYSKTLDNTITNIIKIKSI